MRRAGLGLPHGARRLLLVPAAAPRRRCRRAGPGGRAHVRGHQGRRRGRRRLRALRRGPPAGRPDRARDRARAAPTRAGTASSGSACTTRAPRSSRRSGEHFELHPLAVEDAVHAHQRPKLEMLRRPLFLVIKTARYVDSEELVEIGEVMVFVGPRLRRHGPPRRGQPAARRARWTSRPIRTCSGIGPSSVLYAVADRIVDDYAAVIEGLAVDIDEVEAEVFCGAGRQPDRADLQAQARGARVQARGRARWSRRCSGSPPIRPACRSTLAPPTTSATSTTT